MASGRGRPPTTASSSLPGRRVPASGERRATFAFIAPGQRADEPTGGRPAVRRRPPGEARVVAIEAGQALLRANTVDADVALRTNAIAEAERGSELVLGCRLGSFEGASDWPEVPESVCNTFSTVHQTAPGHPDLIAVPEDREVREVVWEVRCPERCDPEGGPFAARVVLERVVVTVAETDPPVGRGRPSPARGPRGYRSPISSGWTGSRSPSAIARSPSRTRRAASRAPASSSRHASPARATRDRRLVFEVELPADAGGEPLAVRAVDALGNEAEASAEVPG